MERAWFEALRFSLDRSRQGHESSDVFSLLVGIRVVAVINS